MIKLKYLITLTLLINICASYKTYTLNDKGICPSLRDKIFNLFAEKRNTIFLKLNNDSSVIINERWNSSTYKKLDECKFIIDATKYSAGIIIFIEKVNLRVDKITNECIDYLQIRLNNGMKVLKLCNYTDLESYDFRSHIDEYGKITMKLYIEKKIPLNNIKDTLELKIVATAYQSCAKDIDNSFSCYKDSNDICISKYLVNDSVHNCPLPACADEITCNLNAIHKLTFNDDIISTRNLVISALTSTIFTMIGVGLCVYAYWKYKECARGCCMSSTSSLHDTSRNPRRRHHTDPTAPVIDMDLNEVSSAGSTPIRPSHNRRNREATSKIDEKDLPPSYDSLFPTS